MASNKRTYTVRNKFTGEIVGYWDNLPTNDETVRGMLRREFGQGRFQITYTGRKKVADGDGEKWVTYPVNAFYVVGNPQTGIATYQGGWPAQHSGGDYKDFILPFVTETRQAINAMANEIQAMSDTLAIVRGNLESLLEEDESGTFDDEAEAKSGFGLESLASNPKYAWAIPLFLSGDKEALINGITEKLKTEPTLLHEFISDLLGGMAASE